MGFFSKPLFAALKETGVTVFNNTTLNAFMELTREHWREVRATVQEKFRADCNAFIPNEAKVPLSEVNMHLPARIGDYTDFYSSKNHAFNVGCMFRGPEQALKANWTYLPVGYHGRSSSVVVSGTDIRRPHGQTLPTPTDTVPVFGASKRCDFELEMGFFYGGPSNGLGNRLDINKAEEHIFGMVLLNDWSARDIQKWEYEPLGPFTAKNQGTVISPWVVTLDALEPFRCESEVQNPAPLDYLKDPKFGQYDIKLQVFLKTEKTPEEQLLTSSNFKYMYWSMPQQLTHHTVSGCNMMAGDLYGSGTISGKEEHEFGSMLELCWAGKKEIKLLNGEIRKFLLDNDRVTMKGCCEKDGVRVGFGECVSSILPAN